MAYESSSAVSFSPHARRIAAADLLGSMAGDIVKSVLNESAERWLVEEWREDGLMDVIACEVDVVDSAPVISCFSLY